MTQVDVRWSAAVDSENGSFGILIDGGERPGHGEPFEIVDPFRGETVAEIAGADAQDLEDVMHAARAGAAEVAALPRWRRAEILRAAAGGLEERGDELAVDITRATGKALKETRREVVRSSATMQASAAAALEGADRWLPADGGFGGDGLIAYEIRVPVGIVGAITPFNAPLNLSAHKVGPAIAAGNAVVLKPSSRVPIPALKLGEILIASGLPPAAIAVLPGGPAIGEALVGHPAVGFVSFTGGRAGGDAVRRAAGDKRIALELGGNAAAIVHGDADIESAAQWLTWGAFGNAGQSCNSAQRILVQASIWDAFLSAYLPRVRALRAGDPLDPASDLGTLVTKAEAERVERLVQGAIAAGGSLLVGGERNGALYQPTVLSGVPPREPLACEEAFGPVVLVDTYETLDDAIARANDTEFGLTSAVFTRTMAVAAHASARIRAGVVNVNRSPNYRLDHLPYGGVKASGVGREGPRFAAEEMTERRLVLVDALA
jgi:acyl-CoA reductase-like NAD-dependent aldehyde dehydrogenase